MYFCTQLQNIHAYTTVRKILMLQQLGFSTLILLINLASFGVSVPDWFTSRLLGAFIAIKQIQTNIIVLTDLDLFQLILPVT